MQQPQGGPAPTTAAAAEPRQHRHHHDRRAKNVHDKLQIRVGKDETSRLDL
jgi:hypothetical protein